MVAEVIEELGIQGNTICVAGVGCHGLIQLLLDTDMILSLHGRAPATAAGIKRALTENQIVFTFQGDGDLAGIGIGEIIRSITRGDKLTTIFCNNAVFGTTGGQMAPTTLINQVTTTTPNGRNPETFGLPIHVAELLATLPGVVYSARWALTSLANYYHAKKAIETAFKKQIDGIGYSFVEVLSATPICWKMRTTEALKWVEEYMIPEYPLGEWKNIDSALGY
jgi:2-oxoglutarate ferredoxin oxidoreductase subunit beta